VRVADGISGIFLCSRLIARTWAQFGWYPERGQYQQNSHTRSLGASEVPRPCKPPRPTMRSRSFRSARIAFDRDKMRPGSFQHHSVVRVAYGVCISPTRFCHSMVGRSFSPRFIGAPTRELGPGVKASKNGRRLYAGSAPRNLRKGWSIFLGWDDASGAFSRDEAVGEEAEEKVVAQYRSVGSVVQGRGR
jgi:hypothetical protein